MTTTTLLCSVFSALTLIVSASTSPT
jgi:hypothetical protein